MSNRKQPVFSALSREDAVGLIERNHIGRIAFTFHDRVDIEPISYVYADEWLYARTSEGTKLTTVQHHPWVAFEVDEVTSRLEWRSVVARGTIYLLDPERGERAVYERAVEALRSVDADAFTGADATPFRRTVLCIHIDDITGRQASTT
jgi:nitroimidazol reductase NimA-like FMN-containing flavoprotein (pyridoxamine 5'-phosphate oxidase superfamily)